MRPDRLRHIKCLRRKFKILCYFYPWLRSVPQKSIFNYLKPICPYLLVVHLDSQSLFGFFVVTCSPEHFFIGRDFLPLFRDFIERITLAINQQAIADDCRLGSFLFLAFFNAGTRTIRLISRTFCGRSSAILIDDSLRLKRCLHVESLSARQVNLTIIGLGLPLPDLFFFPQRWAPQNIVPFTFLWSILSLETIMCLTKSDQLSSSVSETP